MIPAIPFCIFATIFVIFFVFMSPSKAEEPPNFGWIGASIRSEPVEAPNNAGIGKIRGGLVVAVGDNGPAKTSGLESGDVIVRFDGHDYVSHTDFRALVLNTAPGKQVKVETLRNGGERTAIITVGRLADDRAFYERGRDFLYTKRDLPRALSDFNEAISRNPKLADAYRDRAIVYEKERSTGAFPDPDDRAYADFRTAIALGDKEKPKSMSGVKRISTRRAPAVSDLTSTQAAFSNPSGAYLISGTNPDQSTYSGEAAVEPDGDRYRASWNVAGRKLEGLGLRYLNFFAVALHDDKSIRLGLFAQEGEGRLGVWAINDGQKMGSERWARTSAASQTGAMLGAAESPEGEFRLSGVYPDGSTYSGKVVVTRVGDIFQVVKTVKDEKFNGSGVAYEDVFAIAYPRGETTQIALMAARVDGEIGLFVQEKQQRLGAERWERIEKK